MTTPEITPEITPAPVLDDDETIPDRQDMEGDSTVDPDAMGECAEEAL